jgi:hypothetical protein
MRSSWRGVALGASAAALAAVLWTLDTPGGVLLTAIYLLPLLAGVLGGWAAVLTYPVVLAPAAAAGNSVAPSAWTSDDLGIILVGVFCAALGAVGHHALRAGWRRRPHTA